MLIKISKHSTVDIRPVGLREITVYPLYFAGSGKPVYQVRVDSYGSEYTSDLFKRIEDAQAFADAILDTFREKGNGFETMPNVGDDDEDEGNDDDDDEGEEEI
ncbi:MAG: hypothetical protein J5497_02440 [Selenomonadaceae bacterium]|nr:hypothetical protein [Selenomonadaceae bacterium]